MPRDYRTGKPGQPRQRYQTDAPQQPKSKRLRARIEWWEEVKMEKYREDAKHDGNGNTYHRPGSQRKGRTS